MNAIGLTTREAPQALQTRQQLLRTTALATTILGPANHSGPGTSAVSTFQRPFVPATPEQLAAFGLASDKGGVAIANKSELLPKMWRACGFEPDYIVGLAEMGSQFGHAFSAFKTTNPTTGKLEYMVPNIVGVPGQKLVQWCSLEEYCFGISEFKGANRQRGMYNRPFTLVAIKDAKIDVQACRAYVDELSARAERGNALFLLMTSRIINLITLPFRKIRLPFPEFGNCARWNSMMGRAAGVFTNKVNLTNYFTQTTMWPKRLPLRLIEGKARIAAESCKIIHLGRPQHAQVSTKDKHDGETLTNIFSWIGAKLGIKGREDTEYSQLRDLADVNVEVASKSITAEVTVNASRALQPG